MENFGPISKPGTNAGMKSGTKPDGIDGLGLDTPLTSEGYGTSETLKSALSSTETTLHSLASHGSSLLSDLKDEATANPWLTIGLVSVGALAIGYIVGRVLPVSNKFPVVHGIAGSNGQLQGYDE